MTSTETPAPVSTKTCTCDDKFIVFMKSKQFEDILKDAIQNVMGEIIRNILKHQIKDDLSTIISKTEKIGLDLKNIKSTYGLIKKSNVIEGEEGTIKDQFEDDTQYAYENPDDDEHSYGISHDNISNHSLDESETGNKENNGHENRVQGVVKWFSLDKGYGFITLCDTLEQVFVHKSSIKTSNPDSQTYFLQAGEMVELTIELCKKGPEARKVTRVNGTAVTDSLLDPSIKTSLTKDFLRSYSRKNQDTWNFNKDSRSSSVTNNFRRGSRNSRPSILSASTSLSGSKQSINGRAASSDGRSSRRGSRNRGKNWNRGTLSADGSHRGSNQSIFNSIDPSYNAYNYSNMYSSYQYSSTQPSTSSYYDYTSNI